VRRGEGGGILLLTLGGGERKSCGISSAEGSWVEWREGRREGGEGFQLAGSRGKGGRERDGMPAEIFLQESAAKERGGTGRTCWRCAGLEEERGRRT